MTTPDAPRRWEGRPGLARAVRVVVTIAPVTVAIGCTSTLSRALPDPLTSMEVARWWAMVLVVSTSAVVVTDRFTRRLLPLSVLLRLSLAFPDAPPSRIKVAIRSGSPKQLEQWAASVSARGRKDPKAVAAHELLALVAALSAHDRRSRGHSERVRVYTDLMAEQLGLSRDDTDRLRWAGLLHDIGKIHVPGEILNKPGVPDEAEWEAIRGHPEEGDRLIEPVRAWLGPWGKAVVEHHERWDGKGYPRGISGMQISLAGRVIAVTDSYEVMTATRSYKKPMSAKAAREELTRSAGSHFDPAMVRAFLSVPIGRVSWSAGPVAWLAQLPFLAQIPTWGATAVVATGVMVATPTAAGTTPPWPASTPAPVQVDAPPPSQGDSSQSSITIAPAVAGPTDTSSQDAQVASDSSGGPPTPPPGQQKRSTTTTTTAPESTTITTTTRPTTTTDSSTTTVPGKGNGPGGKGKGKNSSSSSG